MEKLFKIIKKKFDLDNPTKSTEFIEAFYAKKYGSKENAVLVFKAIRNSCNNEKEFQSIIVKKIEKDFHYNLLKQIVEIFKQSKGLFSLIKNLKSFAKNIKDKDSVHNEIIEIQELNFSLASELKNLYGGTKKQLDINNCSLSIEDYLFISLAQIRKECGYPDKRTFDKWLETFFGTKYLDKGHSNGYVSIEEYAEILKTFLLKPEESNFPSDLKELENRFDEPNIPKKKLKIYTNGSYPKLNDLLDDIAYFKGVKLPDNFRNIPLSLTYEVIKESKNFSK